MLTLIAIRPLQGCAEYIRKCLQAGNFYYFCDQFDISKDGEVKRNRDRRPVIPDLYRINGGHTHISLSAIVGKNGDGKSTIVELMLRLINNYALFYVAFQIFGSFLFLINAVNQLLMIL